MESFASEWMNAAEHQPDAVDNERIAAPVDAAPEIRRAPANGGDAAKVDNRSLSAALAAASRAPAPPGGNTGAPGRVQRAAAPLQVGRGIAQAKLSVGASDDPYEREADAVAKRVVRSLRSTSVQRQDSSVGQVAASAPRVQRIQRAAGIGAAGGDVDSDTERRVQSARSGGKALPDHAKSQMEGAFGADFGGVRIHEGAQSTELNNRIQAKAFTTGRDIFFRDGMPDTSTADGQSLLAHELTHTIQQGAAVHRSTDQIQRLSWPWKHAAPPAPAPATISAPANVHGRAGGGDVESLGYIEKDMDRPNKKAQKLLGEDFGAGLAPEERDKLHGEKAELAPLDESNPELGMSPVGETVPGPHQQFQDSEELGANDLLFPSPSIADIDLPTKAVLEDDPVGVISAYTTYAGQFLQHTQSHDVKIERYARFMEADFEFVAGTKEQFEAATAANDETKQKKLEKEVGGNPIGEFHLGKYRLERAHIAEAASDREVPLVDGIYEQARDNQKAYKKSAGGRSITHIRARLEEHETQRDLEAGKGNPKKVEKHHKAVMKHKSRLVVLEQARGEGTSLGKLVQQAKISESALRVKRMGLKEDKKTVKKVKGRAVGSLNHYGKLAGTKALSAVAAAATLGIVNFEQEKGEGGYSTSQRFTPMWTRMKGEFTRIQDMADKRPYGPATDLHVVMEILSIELKELRNVLGSAALIALAISLIPGAAVVAGPIASVLGTLSLGFAAVKLFVDLILASWSVIQRIRTSNDRNKMLLTSQATRQGVAVLEGAATMGMAFAGPALGNSVDGPSAFADPTKGFVQPGAAATTAGASIGGKAANAGIKQAGGLAAVAGGKIAGNEKVNSAAAKQATMGAQAGQSRSAAHGEMPSKFGSAGAAAGPEWLKQAQADEAAARKSSLDALVGTHSAKIKRFHSKTQALMVGTSKLSGIAPGLGKAAKKKPEDGDLAEDSGTIVDMAKTLGRSLGSVAALSGDVDTDALRADVLA
ncbi:MAG: hypothetical protein ACJAXA_000349 [Candidatus Aldehydirespiratoraceae bacterium]|jgi:hypothetical protein